MAFNLDLKKIKSLKQKKFRDEYKLYIVEGKKIFGEAIKSNIDNIEYLILTQEKYNELENEIIFYSLQHKITIVSSSIYESLSLVKTAPELMLVIKYDEPAIFDIKKYGLEYYFLLDQIQDPGNMGSIIRTCDWFGINTLFVTENCVDIYNPKVPQSSMGSLFHIDIQIVKEENILSLSQKFDFVSADMQGESMYDFQLKSQSIFVIGNESHGVSETMKKISTRKINIPNYGEAESLNASIAQAILCSYFKKK